MFDYVANNEFIILNTAYVKLGVNWNYQNVISPFYRLYYITAGTGMVTFENQVLVLKPGFMYLIPSFALSHYTCSDFLHQYYLHFEEVTKKSVSIKFVYELLYEVKASESDIYLFERLLEINSNRQLANHNPKILTPLNSMAFKRSIATHLETNGIILQLFSRFLGNPLLPLNADNYHYNRISKSLQHIHEHLEEELTVENLALIANLNVDYFSRIFKALVGLRPIAYIHQVRIQKAQQLLLFSELSQDQIAESVGFPNRTYFAKIFKEHTGQSAGKYRKQSNGV